MCIDMEELKPRNQEYFMYENGVQLPMHIGQTRYKHYCKKRQQCLAILKVRMDDFKSGEMFKASLNKRLSTAPAFQYMNNNKMLSPASITQISNQFTNAMTPVSVRPNSIQTSSRVPEDLKSMVSSPTSNYSNLIHVQLKLNRNFLPAKLKQMQKMQSVSTTTKRNLDYKH